MDVHRKENVGSTEKAITIYGQPENCTKACAEILKVESFSIRKKFKLISTSQLPVKVMREEAKTAAAANAEGGGGDNGADSEGDDNVVSLKVRH